MSDLSAILNKGRKPVEVVKRVDRFDVKEGPIPYMVPVLRKDQRTFAGGRVVLKEKLHALRSKDDERINGWGNYYNIADACLTFEDTIKLQLDSPLLTRIRGVVRTNDGLYVAVDANAVELAVSSMEYFKVSDSETVTYDSEGRQREKAQDVVLLQYNVPYNVQLTADQFKAVKAKPMSRKDILHNRDMSMDEIIKRGKVIHPVWDIYPASTIVPLVQETFTYDKERFGYDKNMGAFLPAGSQNHAEMRALFASRLGNRSGLYGNLDLGNVNCRLVGVVDKAAEGGKPKK